MAQADPDPKRFSRELHARRLQAEPACKESMPKSELTFDEAVAAKTSALDRKAKKSQNVRITMKRKQKVEMSSSDSLDDEECNSSLSSDSSSSDVAPNFGEMVAGMVPDNTDV